ncbi:MAG: 1-(5-phosphoribosyl)-5-[(5-phosphoribosylamino)methylideneamino]imidazole-4-carboxamide isomerase [bacterium]|nr:1-(5-phosphoribosyl)-5-[(5-phosphoribosylamino)methylideneamino]imidazole-4-carboxamide isomerase [bacterium]
MKIIPAIDLIDGKCVRLSEGDYATKKVYNENPVEVARQFEASGVKYLHLVDLDGAKAGKIINYKVLESIVRETQLIVDFGGGLRSDEDLRIAFESGASKITGGSIAVKNPTLFEGWLERYGTDKIILGADCKNRNIATGGWLDTSEMDVIEFIQAYQQKGISQVICTDISKDGMLAGPAIELYREILNQTDVALVASGGVTTLNDLEQLKAIGCSGAIIGKALYENKLSLKQIESLC